MADSLRIETAQAATTIVVKVGTRVLTHPDGTLNVDRIAQLADELSAIKAAGRHPILVSSGAVGSGMSQLGLKKRPTDLAQLQAVAAIGQTKLIEAYDRTFRLHGRHAAQVLLTAEDLHDRQRYLNVRNTLATLTEFGAIPVINENDTVAVDELMTTFGDNDRLAAMVTNLLQVPLLIVLSDILGLYDGDPSVPTSRLLTTVTKLDATVEGYVRDKLTGLSKGGMASKLRAARMVTSAGGSMIIASGRDPQVLAKLLAGEPLGTLFLPQRTAISPRKRWIGFSAQQPRGAVVLDAGACRAIVDQGRSLLAIGITSVTGEFDKGDVISVQSPDGRELARGLTNYAAPDLARIQGVKSDKITDVLGDCPYEEVIHRDNLVLV